MNPNFFGSAHTRLIDKPINDACVSHQRITNQYPTTELRCQKAVPSLARRAQDPKHLRHERLLSSLSGQPRATQIKTPICCTGTAERPHLVKRQCSTTGGK